MMSTLSVTTPTDREIVMTRTFDAPKDLVFDAMSTADHIRKWWGWSSWTMTTCEFDSRPGGSYRFVSRSPEGQEVPFTGRVLEIDRPNLVVLTAIYGVEPYNQGEPSVVTTTFDEKDGRTTITVTSRYQSKEVRDAVLATGMESGAAHSYDRLAELLSTLR